MIYSVSYELRKPGQDYSDLYETIEKAPAWHHAMTSHWFIRTEESVQAWSDKLLSVIDKNDYIFVVDITSQPRQGWMPEAAWNWLRENQYKKTAAY